MPNFRDRPENLVSPASGSLESIQLSKGGVPKLPVKGEVRITKGGVEGDRQRDLRYHGGPDRALCLLAQEIIDTLRGYGHPIDRGTTGENLTISGLDWGEVQPGVRMSVGEVVLEITKAAPPCKNIADSFADGDFSPLSAKIHPGRGRMYARVIVPGRVRAGDRVSIDGNRLNET